MSDPRHVVTVTETVRVRRPPEEVFDYTQDYARRSDWDRSVTAATILADDPRSVRVDVAGVGRFTITYRLFRRPERTSAAFTDVESRWITGGGGSWRYEPSDGGTAWTQTNTFELRTTWYLRLLVPFVRWNLRRSMRTAMAEAKRRMER